MDIYICLRCNKSFKNNKFHLKKHLLRKFPCNSLNRDISCKLLLEEINNNNYIEFYQEKCNEYKCNYCDKYYKHQSSMIKHRNNCLLNPIIIKKNKMNEIKKYQNNSIINNIQNQQNINNLNNIHIHINSMGNEKFNIKEITEKLNLELNYSNFNGIKFKYDDRINNLIDNYGIIFDNIYENPDNHNFAIVNKNKKICKIKDSDDGIKHINFEDLTHKIFNIIDNVFDLSIIEFEMNNDKESLYHYKEFKKKLVERRNMFIEKYYSSDNSFEKKNIYNSLYQYFKGFKNLVNNIKDKIILKSYDIDL
jgi:hypothetical protein